MVIDVKNVFYVFYSCHVFTFFKVFYFVNVFYFTMFIKNFIEKFEKHF